MKIEVFFNEKKKIRILLKWSKNENQSKRKKRKKKI